MARGLSTDAKNYAGPRRWTADITTPKGTLHYFWDGERDQLIGASTYKPYLRVIEGFRRSRSLRMEAGSIELVNADLVIGRLLETENFEGGAIIVKQFLVGVDESIEIGRGRLAEQRQTPRAISFRISPEFDPTEFNVPDWIYDPLCRHRFAKPGCGYDRPTITVTENLAERTSTSVSSTTIADSALAEVVNAHVDRFIVLTSGANKNKVRRIRSNTATTFTFYQPISALVAGDKFKVFSAANGMPKLLSTATSSVDKATATIFTARTIGSSALSMTVDEHKSDGPEADAAVVRIVAGTGSGQEKKIKTNTATTFTIADEEADFNPVPDATSEFRALHLRCPKDIAEACEQRGRTHAFSGAPTLSPELAQLYPPVAPPAGGGRGRDEDEDFAKLAR